MFNFTTQTIFNQISTSGAKKNLIDNSGNSKVPSLRIGNTRFDAADIQSIQVKAPSAEQLGSVTFDISEVIPTTPGEVTTGRIVLYLGLSMGSQDSYYSNALVYKGKPFYVEFPVSASDSADVVARRVKAIADKYILFETGEKERILDVSYTATAAVGADPGPAADAVGKVTFTCVNGYQIIKKAVLQKYNPNAHTVDCCTNEGDFVDVITGVPVIYKIVGGEVKTKDGSGKQYFLDVDGTEKELGDNQVAILPSLEAFGDYNWIIHNLRLPTLANTNFWSPTKGEDELPIVGQTYTQFIITMCKDRDGIAGGIVGQRATSVTTHVLYVAGSHTHSGDPAYTVYTKLYALKSAAVATTADTKLANPFGTAKSLTT